MMYHGPHASEQYMFWPITIFKRLLVQEDMYHFIVKLALMCILDIYVIKQSFLSFFDFKILLTLKTNRIVHQNLRYTEELKI
jgi:hypothetical protein